MFGNFKAYVVSYRSTMVFHGPPCPKEAKEAFQSLEALRSTPKLLLDGNNRLRHKIVRRIDRKPREEGTSGQDARRPGGSGDLTQARQNPP